MSEIFSDSAHASSILEAVMLICFSISWYWSIARMLKVRKAVGKSCFFVVLICTGYIFGLGSKLVMWNDAGSLDPIVWLYAWNLVVTLTDLALVLYFTQNDAMQARRAGPVRA